MNSLQIFALVASILFAGVWPRIRDGVRGGSARGVRQEFAVNVRLLLALGAAVLAVFVNALAERPYIGVLALDDAMSGFD